MWAGPQPQSRSQRLQIVDHIVAASEATWTGLEEWLAQQEIALDARVTWPWA